jgi:hypothetical protein
MMIEFHPAALSELIDSAGYYDSKLPGLDADFLNEHLNKSPLPRDFRGRGLG